MGGEIGCRGELGISVLFVHRKEAAMPKTQRVFPTLLPAGLEWRGLDHRGL